MQVVLSEWLGAVVAKVNNIWIASALVTNRVTYGYAASSAAHVGRAMTAGWRPHDVVKEK